MRFRLFVYGTLKPGGQYHDPAWRSRMHITRSVRIRGRLWNFPRERYPAVVEGPGTVWGVILGFCDPRILRQIDGIEGYRPCAPAVDNLYYRKCVPVFDLRGYRLLPAQTYFIKPQTLLQFDPRERVPSGMWHFPKPK